MPNIRPLPRTSLITSGWRPARSSKRLFNKELIRLTSFKNPSSKLAAGYLIDNVGLKGVKKGDAMIWTADYYWVHEVEEITIPQITTLNLLRGKKLKKLYIVMLQLQRLLTQDGQVSFLN